MTLLRDALVLAAKDLRQEVRTRHALALTVMTGLLVVVVLALGFGAAGARATGPGAILWTAFIFAGTLCFERTMAREHDDDAMAALLMAPIDRSAIFLGKFLANLALLVILVVVVTPVAVLLLRLDLAGVALPFSATVLLGIVGLGAAGTLFSATVGGGRSGVLALALLPLSMPLVLVSSHMLDRTLARAPVPPEGLPILVAFDALFLAAGYLAYESAVETRGAP